ncbi:MAG: hypothetical protein PVG30_07285 [Gammaproteobacteria bacterium]|jgi:hypothetical protein
MDRKQKLWAFVEKNIPSLLSNLDKDPDSPTYGCFDRNYWHYKISDFSSFVLQQSAFTIGYLYHYPNEQNIYFQNPQIKEWSLAGLRYWARNLYQDGSADEYYPFEKGIPPVAFSLYRMTELFEMFADSIYKDKTLILNGMKKAAIFLAKNPELQASNQEMFAITAILKAAKLLQHDELQQIAIKKLKQLITNNYSAEGWFKEYGGPDLGYLSLTLEALVDYNLIHKETSITTIINSIVEFSNIGIFDGGIVGGQFNSRNTEYYLPYGLAKISTESPLAKCLLQKLLENIDSPTYQQGSFDDRYRLHYVMPSFVKTLSCITHDNLDNSPLDKKNCWLKEAGWYFKKINSSEILVNTKKGGNCKIVKNGRHFFTNCGYRIYLNNKLAVTNWENASKANIITDNELEIHGDFIYTKYHIPTPFKHFILRIVARVFGRKIIKLLKQRLIFPHKKSDVRFIRKLVFTKDELKIHDHIVSKNKKIATLKIAPKYSMRHVASSKSFVIDELKDMATINQHKTHEINLEQTINLHSENPTIQHNVSFVKHHS